MLQQLQLTSMFTPDSVMHVRFAKLTPKVQGRLQKLRQS